MMVKSSVKGLILLVDDDRQVLTAMSDWLRSCGYEVDTASSLASARQMLSHSIYDIALVDIRLGDGDGFDLLREIKEKKVETSVILITGYGTVESAVAALKDGAFDFLTKPLIDQELELSIERALNQQRVLSENTSLKSQLQMRYGLENIVGHDHRMQKIYDMIESVADTRATILITGESGTGKSLVARAIHYRSNRREKPFVEVACGALPETLLESELFGHVAGSFTGATGDKVGKFLQADQGTIFLDEIGTSSQGLQVKLLRVLQELAFEPVGGNETLNVDTRVILATNEDLGKAVEEKRFRQDLYYRINVINIELPPLRERIGDIPLLARHFLSEVREETGKDVSDFDPRAIDALQSYSWPGNVRELQNIVERSVLLGKGPVVTLEDLPESLLGDTTSYRSEPVGNKTLKEALEGPERQIIQQVLESNQWNRNATADALGINRTTLYKKMKRLGLDDAPHGKPVPESVSSGR